MISPICGCMDGYYPPQEETEENISCIECPPNCLTCENGNTCSLCKNPLFLPPLCLSAKKGNYLEKDNQGKVLVGNCDPKCDSCTESPNICSKCSKGKYRRNIPPHCECKYGFHDNFGTEYHCSLCPKLCKSCNSNT